MESRNIIIILVAVIVILAAAIGFALMNPTTAKEPTKINITSDMEQYEGGELAIRLTDLNSTPISKEIVNITVTDSSGETVVDDVVKTDMDGNAVLDLNLAEGTYNVTVTYDGNENYTQSNATQELIIRQEVVETAPQSGADSNPAEEEIDYNSPDSEYFKWDTDGSYHKKQEGASYFYAQDEYTGEWSYWANKT